MFDDFSKRAKAVRAALALAQHRKWGDIALADIAQAAGLSLSDLRHEFSSRATYCVLSRPRSTPRSWPSRRLRPPGRTRATGCSKSS